MTKQVVKKKGLIQATKKSGGLAGEGHAYLRNWIWWTGMIMMILGEICNFAAFGECSRSRYTGLREAEQSLGNQGRELMHFSGNSLHGGHLGHPSRSFECCKSRHPGFFALNRIAI